MAHGNGRRPRLDPAEMRSKYAKYDRLTQRSLDDARKPVSSHPPGSEQYRAEMDSVSEVTIGREGVKLKSRAPWLQFAISLLAFLAFVAWLFKR